MFCPNCGANISSSEYVCPKCNNVLRQPEVVNSVNDQDTPTIGLKLVSFLVPIVGIILYFLWSKEFPVKAKSCLKLSLISIAIGFISALVLPLIFSALIVGMNTIYM